MLNNFLGILVMLNNFYHDFASAILVVCTVLMFVSVKYGESIASNDFNKFLAMLFPRLMHASVITLVLLLFAGVIRSFTYSWYEWVGDLGSTQIIVLIFKHVLMFSVTAYLIYIWIGVYNKIKIIRKELSKN